MLDSDTRRRIDAARDILVGKVPDPKSQVEQITIALIYKFMDDMDAESEELGGERSFFVGDLAPYRWARLTAPDLGGYEALNLYAEALGKIAAAAHLPALFRDMFKNAYLPYRDPETLRAFFKTIGEFTYDHSERLGDAFEYLLSVLGAQGDAGQFRTPRHIIDFIVAIVDPKKDETILDPACGTAGFLISAYKHIQRANTSTPSPQPSPTGGGSQPPSPFGRGAGGEGGEGGAVRAGDLLTPDDRRRLAGNLTGYDISPDMVRLSLVNMYLHGFASPRIYEYDTLTSEEKWGEYADVILANPPFMSPKGGIRPHKRFRVQSKRSEVLFVDYIAEHLTPTGRAGVIVPEGVIFQSGSAYVALRKMLIEDYLVGVISLPSGVFQPYTAVKTSILILDRPMARKSPHIIFSDVRHIGMSLGIKRTPTEHNDLPYVIEDFRSFYQGAPLSAHSWLVERSVILNNDCSLSGSRYRPVANIGETRFAQLGEVCALTKGSFSSTMTEPGPYPLIVRGEEQLTSAAYQFETDAVCVPLLSLVHGRGSIKRIHYASGKFALANLLVAVQPLDADDLDPRFLYLVLDAKKEEIAALMKGAIYVTLKLDDLSAFRIPLPPLEVQREIVAEIEEYQRVIAGARQVLAAYRPRIPIDPSWPLVEVGRACIVNPRKSEVADLEGATEVSFVPMSDIGENAMYFEPKETKRLDEVTSSYTYFRDGDVLLAKVTPCFENGKAGIARGLCKGIGFGSSEFYVLRPTDSVLPEWVFLSVATPAFRAWATPQMTGTGGLQRVPRTVAESYKIPLPPLEVQRAIVAEIEAEQALVAANRELIARFERKIQATIARVWGAEP